MTTRAVLYWEEKARGRPTIAYAVSVDHANNLACQFNRKDVRAAVILGNTKHGAREETIRRFRDGDLEVLVNVAVATEGFDLPDASCVLITRPTKSLALYLQMVGRGLRPKAGGGDCLILDLADNAEEHGLPETIRRWSLYSRSEQPAGDPPVSYCPACGFTTHPANHECPNCHAPLMKKCGRCGVHRPWSAWSSTSQCPVDHEAVCDRCHDDKHVELELYRGNSRSPERDALVALYENTGGKTWEHNSNWMTEAPLSEWHGITTDHNGRVTEVDLKLNQLTGPIPTELADLDNLRTLQLMGNELTGRIPAELAQLTNLEGLDLAYNRLIGPIPVELATLYNLRTLSLSSKLLGVLRETNRFEGPIPAELATLTNLERLNLDGNQLTGSIPPELAQLARLEMLCLGANHLTGPIPVGLAQLTKLQTLALNGKTRNWFRPERQLTGSIPAELAQLTNLETLCLDHNQLAGPIPIGLGRLTKLRTLDLGNNQLTGPIPVELASLTGLQYLGLGSNRLSGAIPGDLAQIDGLQYLQLCCNQISGSIPWELGRLSDLTHLMLGSNHLSGEIPWAFGLLTNLQYLWLSDNQLSGKIPSQLGQLYSLTEAYLCGSNQLTGPVPAGLLAVASNDFDELESSFA